MRVRVYDFTGRPEWRDEGPSFARIEGYSGQMIVGQSGLRIDRQKLAPLDYRANAAKGWATRKGLAK